MKYENIDEIIIKLKEIKALGYVKTIYSHDGGVGNTLEKLLGIPENNLYLPDLGSVEIKAARLKSNSMLTLTSKAPLPRGTNAKLYDNFSYPSEKDGLIKCYIDIYGNRTNKHGLKIIFKDDKLVIENNKQIEAHWILKDLWDQLNTKADKILLTNALTKGEKNSQDEKFYYFETYLLSGLRFNRFKDAIKNGKVKVELRIGIDKSGKRKGKVHDHGTAIRISKQDFLHLFDEHTQYI
ncbi:MAG: MvaI/BcnI family restriction endonuclease [Patescibacteria group bacterium]|jgi:hypothetical protein